MRIEDILPRPPRATDIHVVTLDEQPREERDLWIWAQSLQGLANRETPHLYLRDRSGFLNADHWLEYYRSSLGLPATHAEGLDGLWGAVRRRRRGLHPCRRWCPADDEPCDHALRP